MKLKRQSHFISMEYDASQQVVSRFIDAVCGNPDDAWAFVSKVYSARLDLNELRELLTAGAGVQHVKIAMYVNSSEKCITRSVYVNQQTNVQKLLHLRMIREPDHNGKWKIFGVEQEECRM